ncbi:MAG: phage regulatory CII family protein [Pseudomonadota bacterium]
MRQSVTSIAQGMVLTAKQSKHIAESIGKPYPTMMRELNPYDHSAKLGAETLLDIMKVTHNIDALQYMAHELGYSLTPDADAEVTLSNVEAMMEAGQKS